MKQDRKMQNMMGADIVQQDGLLERQHDGKIKAIFIALFCFISLQMIWRFLYGFRWPGEYVQTCTIYNYSEGFIIRGFVGSCLIVLFGDLAYDKLFLSLFILAIGLIILFMFIYMAYYFAVKKRNLIGTVIILWFSLSIYCAYLAHEMGYFEQYGYVVIFFVILFLSKMKNRKALISIVAALMFILLLISETNAFLICPTLLSICLIRIVTDAWKEQNSPKKDIVFLVLVNIPNAIYCLFSEALSASPEQVAILVDKIKGHNGNFQRVEEVGGYSVANARTAFSYVKAIHLMENPWQLMVYVFLIMFTIGLMLFLLGKHKEMLLFEGSCCFIVISAYLMGIFGWDLERYRFGQAVGVTLLAIWQLLQVKADKRVLKKDMIYTLIIGTLIIISIMNYRVHLFDGAVYNDNIKQLVDTLRNFTAFTMH